MAVVSATFYWLTCDGCGLKSTEGGDYAAWSDEEGAIEEVRDHWRFLGNAHFCGTCRVPWCGECEREFTDENPRDDEEIDMCVECAAS